MKKNVKLLKHGDKSPIFTNKNIFKKLFSYGIFLTSFISSILLLFKMSNSIEGMGKFNILEQRYVVTSTYVLLAWGSAIQIIRKINTSIDSLLLSYFFGIVGMTYICWIMFGGMNYNIDGWFGVYKQLKWFVPFWAWLILWDALKAFIEYKIRPYYFKFLICNCISGLVFIYLTVMVNNWVTKYWLEKEPFDYLEFWTIFHLILGGLLILMASFTIIKSFMYLKYISSEIGVAKEVHYQQKFLWLSSVFIWFIGTIVFRDFSYQYVIYIILCFLAISIMIVISRTNNEAGSQSSIYKVLSNFTAFFITLSGFLFSQYLGGNGNWYAIIWFSSLTILFLWDVIVSPDISIINKFIEKIFILFIIAYMFMIWFLSNIIKYDISAAPFDISILLNLVPLIIVGVQLLFSSAYMLKTINGISKYSKKIIKLNIKKKSKLRKGVLNG